MEAIVADTCGSLNETVRREVPFPLLNGKAQPLASASRLDCPVDSLPDIADQMLAQSHKQPLMPLLTHRADTACDPPTKYNSEEAQTYDRIRHEPGYVEVSIGAADHVVKVRNRQMNLSAYAADKEVAKRRQFTK